MKSAPAKSRTTTSARRPAARKRSTAADDNFGFPAISNLHSAARPSPERSRLPTTWQDAAADASPAERIEIASKARALLAESPVVAGIHTRITTLVIGTGLNPDPMTGDDVYDQEASAAWEEFCPVADITGLSSMGQLQRVAFSSKIINGDCFGLKCEDEAGEPRLQLIESHRVCGESYSDLLDGLKLDDYGRVSTVRVCLDAISSPYINRKAGKFEEVDAADIVHFRHMARAGEYRPLSAYKSAVNTAHDLADILAFEKAAVKEACAFKDIVETASGEANPAGKTMDRFAIDRPTSAAGTGVAQLYYEKIIGPRTKVMRKGDAYKPYVPNRPSPAWQGYVDFLTACICMPFGFPPSTLLQIKVGGADTRRDLASAARVIQVLQYDFACELQPIYAYVIEKKLGVRGRPKTWQRTEWHGPRSITSDAGREQQQDRENLAMGNTSIQEYCATQETTMAKLFRQNAKAKKLRKKIATEEEVLPEEVFNFNAKSAPIPPAPAPGAPAPEPEPEQPQQAPPPPPQDFQ